MIRINYVLNLSLISIMKITWYGHSLFQIITTPRKNHQVKIVIDPFEKSIGLRVPKLEADILLITHKHQGHNNIKAVAGNPFVIEDPGEYEVKEIMIQGIPSFHNASKEEVGNTIYIIESENLKICHLGDFGQKELSEEQLEKIGDIDILMIPIGGGNTISSKEAAKIMSQLEPKITIPMHYALPKLKTKLDPLSKFLKSFGIKSLSPVKKLSIKKKDLPADEAKIIVLEI